MISRTATRQGSEISTDHASINFFHDHLQITETEVQHKIRYRFLSVVALALFCDYLLLTLCVPILPALFGDNYSAFDIGLIFASKPFFQFLANPYMGGLVDESGPKFPLLFGVLVLAFSTFLFAYGLSRDEDLPSAYLILIIARSVQGVASASTMSAGMTLSALTHHECNRGTAMGISMLGVALGTLLGPPIGGIMGFFLPLWSPYIVVGSLLVVNALAQLYVLHRSQSTIPVYIREANDPTVASRHSSFSSNNQPTQHQLNDFAAAGLAHGHTETNTRDSCRASHANVEHLVFTRESNTLCEVVGVLTLLRRDKILFVVFVAVIGNCCIGMIEPLVPLFLHQAFNQNILQQGLIFATATASYLVFTPLAGMLCDVYPKWACLCLGLCSMSFGLCFFYAATSIARVCVSLAFVGIGMSFVDTPSLPLLSEIMHREGLDATGQVYALSDMALCVGFTLGPILGPVTQGIAGGGADGFRIAALSMGLLCVCICPLPYFILRSHVSASAPQTSQSQQRGGSKDNKHNQGIESTISAIHAHNV